MTNQPADQRALVLNELDRELRFADHIPLVSTSVQVRLLRDLRDLLAPPGTAGEHQSPARSSGIIRDRTHGGGQPQRDRE